MKTDKGSFRDTSGFIFFKDNLVFRQVNKNYFEQFDLLTSSGLYTELTKKDLLIKHSLVERNQKRIILKHTKVPFISYPFEWSFSMFKDAAKLTLEIQKTSLKHNMILKDASAYNISFIGTKPIFIDTLSFDIYKEGDPWIAYKQFCQHFVAPIALMSTKDIRLNTLLRNYIDGIPLDLASRILPLSSKLDLSLLSHIHLHAQNQRRTADKKINKTKYRMSKFQMLSLIANLETTINKMKLKKISTEWDKYYTFTNYNKKAFSEKHKIVESYIKQVKPKNTLDLGANTGEFSALAVKHGSYTIASDIDPLAVESCYKHNKNNPKLLPLLIDLTNPSPAIGWANSERKSFGERFRVDLVMALALVHHLAISNNLPLEMVAEYFSELGKYLIIEFVPKEDSKVKLLLQNREDIFDNYSKEGFENAFCRYYKIITIKKITGSERFLYLMIKNK